MKRKSFLQLAALTLALLPGTLMAGDNSGFAGSVFTMDNSTNGNHVLAFERASDGTLTPAGTYATGGTGTSTGLGNQGSIIFSRNRRWLFACNAGSHDISLFKLSQQGPVLVQRINSGGQRPVSLTQHGNLLYVLNAGGAAGGEDNISGFLFAFGRLFPYPDSTRPLSAPNTGPAQVSFTRDGGVLVVTEKATDVIDTFTVSDDGVPDDHNMFQSPVPTPFGFAIGRENRIFVSEANGGAANASSVSSYEVSDEGDLTTISGAVPTTETAACWVVLTRNERLAYVSNTGSGTISGYRVNRDGELQLLNADGVTGTTGAGSDPIDLALSRDSRYLYSLNSGNGTLSAFRVNPKGSLQALPGLSGIPAGANGLAAQ